MKRAAAIDPAPGADLRRRGGAPSLALGVAMVGAALSWAFSGGPPLIGVDDAAITRAYAENIAGGHGYVYNIGGERVEGSTSALWTFALAAIYALFARPEIPILAAAFAATVWSIHSALSITRLLAERLKARVEVATAVAAVGLSGLFGFFFWSVWSMMELALWSAALLWLTLCVVRKVEGERVGDGALIAAAVILPLIRPEGVAVAGGLLALGALLALRERRAFLGGLAAAAASFAFVTGLRLLYFGQPLPNTFYAKVSSDRLQDVADGLQYLASFVLNAPFAELFLLSWVLAALWAAWSLARGARPGAAGLGVAAACAFGVLGMYAGLGGDHFALWRFYQPIAPLLPIPVALLLAKVAPEIAPRLARSPRLALAAAAALFWLGVGAAHIHQNRFDLLKEFALVRQGVAFGEMLDTVEPRPRLGVVPAGGVALAYDGEILDLMGLNWTEMAHANPVKTGPRNHASFDRSVFWGRPPDLIGRFNKPCAEGDWIEPAAREGALDGLLVEPRFQAEFRPVRIHGAQACWTGFAREDWLVRVDDPRIEPVAWTELTLL